MIKDFNNLTEEEKYLYEAIMCARKIQEFLWGECNGEWGIEEWKRMFRKRLAKIDDIKPDNPHSVIELRKRILQNTALGIAILKMIDNPNMLNNLLNSQCTIPSNLPQYSENIGG
jgi:hypothetical protein